jgi:hypothetical protein
MVKLIVEHATAERGTFFMVDEIERGSNSVYEDSLLITAEYDYQMAAQQSRLRYFKYIYFCCKNIALFFFIF